MLTVDAIRDCLEGVIPTVLATCAEDGTPNVTFVSYAQRVDCGHVALSFQFFSKTRENILANPHAAAYVIHPVTGARYRLTMTYLRTEQEGPLFESMKARLAGIASQVGMSGVFKLLGSDVYHVHDIEPVPGESLPPPPESQNRLSAMRVLSQQLSSYTDVSSLFDGLLDGLAELFDIRHSMLLALDETGERLYTVASRGYPASGVGSEIPLGQGVIGVAAKQRTPIRISHMTAEYTYTRAVRDSLVQDGQGDQLDTEIPFPGLAAPHSQLAVPILCGGKAVGVLYVESPEDRRFSYDDEDVLVSIATQFGLQMHLLSTVPEIPDEPEADGEVPAPTDGQPMLVRRYANHSLFLGEDYLIKGVAGAILWKLLGDFVGARRTEFSNRELRLDPAIHLPDVDDNLETRLILLQRRLAERCQALGIEKTGRGRFRLRVDRPVRLVDMECARGV